MVEKVNGDGVPEPPPGLEWENTVIHSDKPGVERRMAVVAVCPCGRRKFFVWNIIDHESPHLQCTHCGAVFCTGIDCELEESQDEAIKKERGEL